MPGRHLSETPQSGSAHSAIGTLVIVTLAVVAILAGVATIAARIASSASRDQEPSAIVVQPSASLSGPPAAIDGLTSGDLFPSSFAVPTPSASPDDSSAPTATALIVASSQPAAPTAAPSPATRASRTATPPTSPTTTALISTPKPPGELTAGYTATSTSANGFSAGITVHNSTPAGQAWTVVLTYPSNARITITGYWNATPTASGRRLSFEGGPLPAGASYTFGFEASIDKDRDVEPTGCTINGVPCTGF